MVKATLTKIEKYLPGVKLVNSDGWYVLYQGRNELWRCRSADLRFFLEASLNLLAAAFDDNDDDNWRKNEK